MSDLILILLWVISYFSIDISYPIVWIDSQLRKQVCILIKYLFIKNGNSRPKYDWVGYFHHGGFHVQREKHLLVLGVLYLFC